MRKCSKSAYLSSRDAAASLEPSRSSLATHFFCVLFNVFFVVWQKMKFPGISELNKPLIMLVVGFYTFAAAILLRRLLYLTSAGGDSFQTADWLINFSSGPIRRGFSGEFVFFASSVTGIGPLELIAFLQGSFALMIIASLTALFLKTQNVSLSALLLLNPFLIAFWVNDTNLAFRKEILGIGAFAPLALNQKYLGKILSCGIFAMAVTFHEGNIFFAPFLIFAHIIYDRTKKPVASGVFIALTSVFALSFAIIYIDLDSTAQMCQRLISAGLDERLCDGIFPWLAEGFDRTIIDVLIMVDQANLLLAMSLIAVVLIFLSHISFLLFDSKIERLTIFMSAAFFIPIFFLATDWSRWLSMIVFAVTYCFFIKLADQKDFQNSFSPVYFLSILSAFLVIGITGSIPTVTSGSVFTLASVLGKVF